ncbi:MAG: gliding motility-associated C-terminal domain-containing protein, partial [Bacteroidia bacterium]|nr:gliding motility-associated C-terminal domain-containing protein [Bacteroidia bacterium]
INLGNDTTICSGDSIVYDKPGFSSYLWNTGNTSQSIKVKTPGLYWLKVKYLSCTIADSVNIAYMSDAGFSLGKDTSLCDESPLVLKGPTFDSYLWNTGSTTQQINPVTTGQYWLRGKNGNCVFRDTILVNFKPLPKFTLGKDLVLCDTAVKTLSATPKHTGKIHKWSDGSTAETLKTSGKGTYSLTITDNGCSVSDTVLVDGALKPSLIPFSDTFMCDEIPIMLSFLAESNVNYSWNDLKKDNPRKFIIAGNYWLKASNSCGDSIVYFSVRDTTCKCKIYVPNVFSPNLDLYNDNFSIVHACDLRDFKIKIYDRWGGMVYKSDDSNFSWDGTYAGKKVPQGVYIYVLEYRKQSGAFWILEKPAGNILITY